MVTGFHYGVKRDTLEVVSVRPWTRSDAVYLTLNVHIGRRTAVNTFILHRPLHGESVFWEARYLQRLLDHSTAEGK
eukprot:4244883-Amphidinium_carterae.5